ncbi:hypothetical protein [Streptomyces sp. KAU_LT]|uniref:hypothetical protein n=1 Tax=Streptomyces sp. KAU_LT TaxID=3046669 RepID=UPI0024B7CB62|nr:hypothetical protein [Streptomyces sp. KAU_LT]MDI9829721.1 hypothetical protein [Streptomyces sp. KAU_LT]
MSTTPAKLVPPSVARTIARQVDEPGTTPLRESGIYLVLVQAGYTAAEIATLNGRTWNHVDLRLRLADLDQAGRDALDAGTLPVGLAWYISRLSAPNQRVMLARWERGDFADAHQASDHAAALRKLESPTA